MIKKYNEMTNEEIEFIKEEFRKNYFSRERYLESVQEEKLEERELKGRLEGRLEGKIEAQQEFKKEIAKNLLKQNVSVDIIERTTGLTKDEILEIQK